jgi:flagellar protein FlaG
LNAGPAHSAGGDREGRALPILVFVFLTAKDGSCIKEHGGTMGMTISSVVSGTSFAPQPELPKLQQVNSAQQRAAVDRFVASLPGNGENLNAGHLDIHRVAADIEQVSQTFNRKLQFVVDHQSQEVIVKVIDKNTDKVIKVLPPEELQRLHRKLKETIGLLFNEKV